jgi:hypothetical protein
MKTRELERLIKKYLAPHLERYRVTGSLLYTIESEHLLKGFYLERTHTKRGFYTWVFVQPLYIPSTHISLTLGERLAHLHQGRDRLWIIGNDDEVEVMREILHQVLESGIKYLAQVSSLSQVPRSLPIMTEAPLSARSLEIIAYAYILLGQREQALNELARLDDSVSHLLERIPERTWLKEIQNRKNKIQIALEDSVEIASGVLKSWTSYTTKNLGISS